MKDSISLKIKTCLPQKIINLLLREGIECFKIKIKKQLFLSIKSKDYIKATNLLKKINVDYQILEGYSEQGLKKAYVFMAIGLIIGLLACIYASMAIFRLVINIDKASVEKSKVIDCLEEMGVTVGSSRLTLDTKAIENKLNTIDGVSYASVKNEGISLIIDIVCELNYKPIEKKNYETLYSNREAIIVGVTVDSGTCLLKKGMIVKKGDPIIFNYYTDKEGNQKQCEAKGIVTGEVSYSLSEKIPYLNENDCFEGIVEEKLLELKMELFAKIYSCAPNNEIKKTDTEIKYIDNFCIIVVYFNVMEILT